MTVLQGDVHDPRQPGPHWDQWRWQRVGQWLMVLVAVAGFAGLMGPGPLCNATQGLGQGAWVRYPRFARANATQQLVLHLPARGGPTHVWLGRELLERCQLAQVAPAPGGEQVRPDGTTYRFDVAPGGGEVCFLLRPRAAGALEIKLGVADTPPVSLSQLVWP